MAKIAMTSDKKIMVLNEGVEGIPSITIDSELSDTSTNPVQNKVIKAAIDAVDTKAGNKQDKIGVSGLLKGDGTTISAAVAEIDYMAPPTGGTTGQILKKTETGTEWANESGGTQSATQTITLTTSGWAQSGNRYAQTVNVTGVTASTPVVLVDVALSGADLDADAAALEAWGIVSANNVAQGAGTLTFYAMSVPSVNIPVKVGVC